MTETPIRFIDRAGTRVGTTKVDAVGVGARRLADMRRTAFSEYPAGEAMRDRARAIRLETLAHLDAYLAEFADAVIARGGTVHFAADAAEANEIAVAIARNASVQRIVKSKSMVTEEIELNHALEAAGMTVVETDLGEFIIQLADDTPSHIIAPVLHMTRQEIGKLFEGVLDVAYTADPTELNAIARRHLRRIFLEADMGISGVNFAVAESGSICLVTNEGNGRLTTTAPRIHLAVMGMERIVPTFADLATMLEVLARSATGQRLSVYTNIVTGPRRPGDPDGPEELHVIILDNGRSEVLAGDETEILACIRCGACLNVCPVYREAGGHSYGDVYPGPIGAVLTPALRGLAEWHDLPHASTLCGACEEACPIRIDIPRMLLGLRNRATEEGYGEKRMRRMLGIYTSAATHPARFRRLLQAGGIAGRAAKKTDGWIRSAPGPGKAWTAHRDLPPPAAQSFHQWWKKNRGA